MTSRLAAISRRVLVLAFAGLLGACSVPETPTDIHDPFEQSNRKVHTLNKGLDRVLLRPASQVYGALLPEEVRTGVDNFTGNLSLPAMVLNKALAGDGEDAIHNLFRFAVNSTIGLGGIFDPATSSFGLEERYTDFGGTLAAWGVPEGAFLEVPVFGTSTERDATGQLVDAVLNPLSVFPRRVLLAGNAGTITSRLNSRYRFAVTFDDILYQSADSYAQSRLFYLDNRRFVLSSGGEDTFGTDVYDDLYGDLYDE